MQLLTLLTLAFAAVAVAAPVARPGMWETVEMCSDI